MKIRLLVLALTASLASICNAQADTVAAQTAYNNKQFAKSAVLYLDVYQHNVRDFDALYNAACSYALNGERDKALGLLVQLADKGFSDSTQLEENNDLSGLHADARWSIVLQRMKDSKKLNVTLWDSPALTTPFAQNISAAEKVAGLSKFWSEAKYNFAYVERFGEIDWDALYLSYLPKVQATQSTAQYYKLLIEFCAKLRDGHTNVYPPHELFDTMWAAPALKTMMVEGKVVIGAGYWDNELSEQGIEAWTEIVSVDGMPVKEYAQANIAPFESASTPQDLDERVYRDLLRGVAGSQVRVEMRDATGRTFAKQLTRLSQAERQAKLQLQKKFEVKQLPGGVMYVAINEFEDEGPVVAFFNAFDRIENASALIIDVRKNGGGISSMGYRILGSLTDKSFAISKWSTRDYLPSYRAWNDPLPDYNSAPDFWPADGGKVFRKPVVVLTSANTFSSAEDFAVAFDSMKRGIIVGEPTGGSTGQPLMMKLPGGGTARICTKRDTYPDGKIFVGVGVQPGVIVHPKLKDLREGVDTVLAAALEVIKQGKVK